MLSVGGECLSVATINLHSRLAPHVAAWGTSKQNWPCQVRTISITGKGRRYAPVRFPGRHGRVVPNDRGGCKRQVTRVAATRVRPTTSAMRNRQEGMPKGRIQVNERQEVK